MSFVAVVGSREVPDYKLAAARRYIEGLSADDVVVSGGARGVDRYAEKQAELNGLPVLSFRVVNLYPNEFESYCITRVERDMARDFVDAERTTVLPVRFAAFAPAAHVRNSYIVDVADRLVAFWDGESRGTKSTLTFARRKGIPVEVVHVG